MRWTWTESPPFPFVDFLYNYKYPATAATLGLAASPPKRPPPNLSLFTCWLLPVATTATDQAPSRLLFPHQRLDPGRIDGKSDSAVPSSTERHGCCCGGGGISTARSRRPPAPRHRHRPRRLLAVSSASPPPPPRAGAAEAGVVRVLAHHAPGLLPLRPAQGPSSRRRRCPAVSARRGARPWPTRGGGRRPHQARAGRARPPAALPDAPPRRRLPPHAQPPLRHVLGVELINAVTAASTIESSSSDTQIPRSRSNIAAATVLLATFFGFIL